MVTEGARCNLIQVIERHLKISGFKIAFRLDLAFILQRLFKCVQILTEIIMNIAKYNQRGCL